MLKNRIEYMKSAVSEEYLKQIFEEVVKTTKQLEYNDLEGCHNLISNFLNEYAHLASDEILMEALISHSIILAKLRKFDETETVLEKVLAIAQRTKNREMELRCFNEFSALYLQQLRRDEAMKFLLRAHLYARDLGIAKLIARCEFDLGEFFRLSSLYNTAEGFYRNVIAMKDVISKHTYIAASLKLSQCFALTQKFDEARELMRCIFPELQHDSHVALWRGYFVNRTIIEKYSENFNLVVEYAKEGLQWFEQKNFPFGSVYAELTWQLINALHSLKEFEKAKPYLERMTEYAQTTQYLPDAYMANLLGSNQAKSEGNYEHAYHCLAEAFRYYMREEAIRSHHTTLELKKRVETEHLELRERQIAEQLESKEQKLLQTLEALAKKDYDLQNIIAKLKVKSENKIGKQNSHTAKLASQIIVQLEKVVQDNKALHIFDAVFLETVPFFLPSLLQKSPNLTPTELRMCAVLRLGMSTKDIASFLHVADESVDQYRHRIRKKLGLNRNDNLTAFLQTV